MTPTKIVLRVNGGVAYYTFLVYAATPHKAGVTAKIHLQSMLGLELY
jgi:hypothetical protein